jgi:hypothetical protein
LPLVVLLALPVMLNLFSIPIGMAFLPFVIPWSLFFCLNTMASVVALLWAGMWFGWSERSQARALIRTILVAGGAPYCMGLLASIVLVQIAPPRIFSVPSGQFHILPNLVQFIPQIVHLCSYFWLIRWARRRLSTALRPGAG